MADFRVLLFDYTYLFTLQNWTMAKRTIGVTIAFTASAFVYYQLVINIGNMAGNTYLNMFLMGLVEGPGCIGAVFLIDKVHLIFILLHKVVL